MLGEPLLKELHPVVAIRWYRSRSQALLGNASSVKLCLAWWASKLAITLNGLHRANRAQLFGQRKMNLFLADGSRGDGRAIAIFQKLDALLHDAFRSMAPAVISTVSSPLNQADDIFRSIDQISRHAVFDSEFLQPLAVGAILTTEHQHHVGLFREEPHRFLPILRRIADVFLPGGLAICGNFARRRSMIRFASSTDNVVCVRYAELNTYREIESLDIFWRFHQHHRLGSLTHRPDDFVVSFVANENDGVTFFGVTQIASK